MSLAVFPTEVGQSIGGANRWGFKLPYKKTPSFRTLHQTPVNNVGELNISLTQFPIWMFEYDLAWMRGDMTPAQLNSAMQQIIGFFGQMQGSANDWLFFDPWDNGSNTQKIDATLVLTTADLTNNSIGVGDGSRTQFQLTRTISGMVDLIQNFVTGYPLVYVGGVLQTQSPPTYSIDLFGNITFNTPPAFGAVVSWFGQWYFRCRFLEDEWSELQGDRSQLWSNHSMKFKSLLR